MSTLDPVQIAALDFARGKPGVAWFLEQGLGKSLTALAEFDFNCHRGLADRMIIVSPNTFKKGWFDEVEKHGFNFDFHIYESGKKEKAKDFLGIEHRNRPPVMILNYEAIRSLPVLNAMLKWAQHGRTYIAIDESIQIKGHKAGQSRAIRQLCSWHEGAPLYARFIRLLSGRPQTQGPQDLWAQMRCVGIFQQANFWAFRNRYCVMGGYLMKEVVRAKNEDELASLMAPVVFWAKKKDWLPLLPRKDPVIRDYEMSGEQAAQYRMMEDEFLLFVENEAITVDVAIAKYEKLAQIQCGFIYNDDGATKQLVEPSNNPRLNLLKGILSDEVEGKTCVVYRHKAVLPLLLRELSSYDCAVIKGGMKPDQVEAEKLRFNADPHCRVILLQAEASKYSHTLLGGPGPDDKCRTMIFYENSYSADTRDQIEDRIHRRGQTGERVLYIDLSGSDLDRRIVKALQRKDALYKSVFKNLKEAKPATEDRLAVLNG